MAYDEILAQRVCEALRDSAGIVERKMFGGVGFMLNGNMACGVNKEDLIVRVGPDGYQATLEELHTRPFDLTGRPMKGWAVVTHEGCRTEEELKRWVEIGIMYASSLPPK